MQQPQNAVDDAVFLQKRLPCQCSQQEIHPHGKNKDHDDKAALTHRGFRQDHSQRIGKEQADDRADKGQKQCQTQCLQIFSRTHQSQIFQGEGSVFVGQSIVQDHSQRNQNEGGGPHHVWSGQKTIVFFIH